tara:strand:+ start:64 stop:210 length:147 start_codon:yes stop_codon:yes gene_type:complete
MMILTMTGRRILPKNNMKIKESNKRIAKYTDSSFEKNLFRNFSNKFCM